MAGAGVSEAVPKIEAGWMSRLAVPFKSFDRERGCLGRNSEDFDAHQG